MREEIINLLKKEDKLSEDSISELKNIEIDDFALNPPPKYFRLKPDGIVRLKGAYIVRYKSCDLDENGEVKAVHVEYLEGTK